MKNIKILELSSSDINEHLLDYFNRYQEVKKYWIKKNENWILIEKEYIEDWDKNKKDKRVKYFFDILTQNLGFVFGAYENNKLIGFSVLLNKKFGTNEQYIQLKYLHVSYGYRHNGIGKKLFELCVKKAKKIRSEKIYISTNDSEETQRFYFAIGCKDAMEINKELLEEEPYDRQMEYIII